ncbi:hypothetical protein [Schaalia turicensis]|uniref:hypothetical protein n=1 Tax=Schaalia turicensis TaxID=131111 RepID=UPI001897ACD1|nr:hypothetical protein [Schaalia turicensis]
MANHRLKVTLTDQPQADAIVSARKVSIRTRLAREFLGDTQELAIAVPGNKVRSVEIVRPDDDLMALAEAVGVTRRGDVA